MGEWSLQLRLVNKRGMEHFEQAVDIEVESFGERLAGEMSLGISGLNFDQTAEVILERRMRTDKLEMAARLLGKRLAEYLEDREGWHGERRQDTILAAERKRGGAERSS
jgi:hypothetical protein